MDIATLALKVDHSDVGKGASELGKFAEAAKKTESSTSNLQGMIQQMTMGMLGATAAVGSVAAVLADMYGHADLMRGKAQELTHAMTSSGATAQLLGESLRAEMTILEDLTQAQGKGLHSLDRMEVLKAKLYSLGPDYRKMIDDEVMGYGDLLAVIEKINAATLKRIELQIQEQEKQVTKATKPGLMASLGMSMPGTNLGGYLATRGLDDDILKLQEENKKLDALYGDRAKIMNKSEFKPEKGTWLNPTGIYTDTRFVTGLVEEERALKPIHERNMPDFQVATTDALVFEAMMKRLRVETELFRKENVDTWQIVSKEIQDSSRFASDSLVAWMDNLDDVGHSWRTLGDTVNSVIRDMIIQMQRAVVQQQLMDPLISTALRWLPTLWTPNSGVPDGAGTGGVGRSGNSVWGPGLANPAGGGSSNPTINVNISSNSKPEMAAQGATQSGADLFRFLEPGLNAWALKEHRQGGLFSRN